MGRFITNPPKPVGRIKIGISKYMAWLALAQIVVDRMTTNVATFPAPNPTLATVAGDITVLQTAVSALGTKSNKGSHPAVLAVRLATLTIQTDLLALLAYVTNIMNADNRPAANKVILSQSGFAAKSVKSTVPKMQFVTFARQTNNKQFPPTTGRINWRRPLGLLKGLKVSGYNIYTGGVLIATTTKTNFTPTPGVRNQVYTIHPMNARGEGNGFTITAQ